MNKSKKEVYVIRGEDGSIKNFIKAIKNLDEVKDLTIQRVEYNECHILSDLCSNQKKILHYAKTYGYYDYPRKITCQELAEKIGMKNETTLELLRKAEKLIFSRILDD